ncbi:MAG: diaminopropionate ammonia-lyase [Rhodoferax sp.]|nr:diaminopropionate ammonia-lyase [Rhodoferax sp.]
MVFLNPHARRTVYPAELALLLNRARARESWQWLSRWPGVAPDPTPLYPLPGLARSLGIAALCVKDESVRSPLGSFKALGAPIALVRHLLRLHPDFEPLGILAGRHAESLRDHTVISATDGNHGRALAAAAQAAGCRCVIVLHAQVSPEREQAIADLGARIVRVAGDYDHSVQHAARLAQDHGWQVVSDTSYEGYEEIPRDVMQGYAIIAEEVFEQTLARPGEAGAFTHVLVQGGVGGLAAGVVSGFWEFQGAQRPWLVVVEPAQADCLLQSAIQGRPARATGSVDSVMAGLACGETSPLAWRFLQPGVDAFMTVDDDAAVQAMGALARGSTLDIPVLAGESGVAGLAALRALQDDPQAAARIGLTPASRVLLISTEGATAPDTYARLVGESASSVLRRQAAWRASPEGAAA